MLPCSFHQSAILAPTQNVVFDVLFPALVAHWNGLPFVLPSVTLQLLQQAQTLMQKLALARSQLGVAPRQADTDFEYAVVESSHPYAETVRESKTIKMNSNVSWLCLEFDSKCALQGTTMRLLSVC